MSIRDRVRYANRPHISRRGLLTGAALGGGLIVAWALWPRAYPPNLAVAEGEHALNGYLKISEDGHVVVVVPQAEMGQGAYSLLPQIVADELGADWRTIAVEPAPINPIYANRLIGEARAEGLPQKLLGDRRIDQRSGL
jgi:isoquinoline 1-oxidoreductase subunit beta